MLLFWLISLLLILLTLVICIRTVMLSQRPEHEDSPTLQKDILQQQLAELEIDLENGTITEQEAGNSRREIETAINSIKSVSTTGNNERLQLKRLTALSLTAFVPLFVLIMYSYLGRPDLVGQQPLQASQDQPITPEQVEEMVAGLEQRLQDNPEDIEGWQMFYRSNMVLERYAKAKQAAEKLFQLEGETPESLLRLVDALAMENEEQLAGKPAEYIQRILELEPDNASALWLAGMAAAERGELQQALNYWERLLPRIEDGTEPKQQLQQMIASTRQQLGMDIDSNVDPNLVSLVVNVYLAPALSDNIAENAMLFVYARSEDGDSIPIAVVREPVTEFPVQVTLDNTNVMMPSRKLGDFKRVQLIARISNSGQAKPENGDLVGAVSNISPLLGNPIDLIIREKIQL